jgi:hypothetical protein
MSIAALLPATQPRSIDEVIAVMTAIDATLPDEDGLKWFNRLYLRVTTGVRSTVAFAFRDPAFLTELDLVFANLYFAALAAGDANPAAAPPAWRPLLTCRRASGVARIQFALAGMSAHINRDLPEGIVQAFIALGGDPITDRVREQDFDSVNDLLQRVETQIKGELAIGLLGELDRLNGPVDDAIAMWNVRAARSAAWTNAQVLWGLRPTPLLRDRFFIKLDRLIGMTARGLLLPRTPYVNRSNATPGSDS